MAAINEDELKARLDPLSYAVLREGATERPFTGESVALYLQEKPL